MGIVVSSRDLSAATNGHLDRSARYRMVLAPLGVSDELRAVLTVDGISWGALTPAAQDLLDQLPRGRTGPRT